MLLKAAEDMNIDLKNSWMIGDSKRDIDAGKNAGCKTIFISQENTTGADFVAKNLEQAVKIILEEN